MFLGGCIVTIIADDETEADAISLVLKADGVSAYNEALITSNITNKIAAQANCYWSMPWAAE